jgi:hypothetical protein
MIGVSLGLGVWPTIFLATTLAYICGFTLGLASHAPSGQDLF